jgi:hypothetical protein
MGPGGGTEGAVAEAETGWVGVFFFHLRAAKAVKVMIRPTPACGGFFSPQGCHSDNQNTRARAKENFQKLA